jgi:hypothetical protein
LAITEIGQVRNVKDIQRLIGCLTALSHFVSQLGEDVLPLYKLLKKSDYFRCMDEMQKALDELKALTSKPPVQASLEPGEALLLYVVATTQVISTALVVEREEPWHVYKVHRLVYYISKVLSDCETRYNQVQKLLYAVLITKCKLLHHFERHSIRVVTSYGLGKIIGNCLAMGRIAKWTLELMGLNITYVPQMVIKSQALADFMAEWTETQQPPPPVTQEQWSMYFNGSFTLNGVGGGVVMISPKGDRLLYVILLHFHVTNNVAEYEALINSLHITTELGVQWLYIHGNSELVVNQVMGESNCRDSCMAAYREEIGEVR